MNSTGKTKSDGWQIGARRTFSIDVQTAWERITSVEGRRIWLGDLLDLQPARRVCFRLADVTRGMFTVFQPLSHLRLSWQPVGYERPSIIQVCMIPSGDKTVIAFHQEQLPDETARLERQAFFQQAIIQLCTLI